MMNNKKFIAGVVCSVLAIFPLAAFAADEAAQLKEKVDALQAQIAQLQQQLADRQGNHEWDPFREMERMQRQMNMMQNRTVPGLNLFETKVDMNQTDTRYVITIDLPGMQKGDIKIELKGRVLIVSGERASESQEKKGNQYFRKERSFGHFMQNFSLPSDAQIDQIDAQYNNGVLTVVVPREKKKEKRVEPRRIIVK